MRVDALFRTDDSSRQLILRLVLGCVFFAHGAQKVLGWFGGHGFSATMHAFTSGGIPAALAFCDIVAEFFGALGLVFGLLTRASAAGIMVVMLAAISLVHARNGFFMNWFGQQRGEGFEFHLLVLAMGLVLLLYGAGKYSIDGVLARRIARGAGPRAPREPVEAHA